MQHVRSNDRDRMHRSATRYTARIPRSRDALERNTIKFLAFRSHHANRAGFFTDDFDSPADTLTDLEHQLSATGSIHMEPS